MQLSKGESSNHGNHRTVDCIDSRGRNVALAALHAARQVRVLALRDEAMGPLVAVTRRCAPDTCTWSMALAGFWILGAGAGVGAWLTLKGA